LTEEGDCFAFNYFSLRGLKNIRATRLEKNKVVLQKNKNIFFK
jgi:hypothetical protein